MEIISNHVIFDLLRRDIGPVFGSEDISVLLYSIVRREMPARVLELGTGLGVTSTWIGRALKENGGGCLTTIDNGLHYANSRTREFLLSTGEMAKIINYKSSLSYGEYLSNLFACAEVMEYIKYKNEDIILDDGILELGGNGVDIVFSDFNHSPDFCLELLRFFIPRLSDGGSIFIDSASTHMASFLALERAVNLLNDGFIPHEFRIGHPPAIGNALKEKVSSSKFILVHLTENRKRSQNSTAWIKLIPNGFGPSFGAYMH